MNALEQLARAREREHAAATRAERLEQALGRSRTEVKALEERTAALQKVGPLFEAGFQFLVEVGRIVIELRTTSVVFNLRFTDLLIFCISSACGMPGKLATGTMCTVAHSAEAPGEDL